VWVCFQTVATCVSTGSGYLAFMMWSWTILPFFFATWEEYYTGEMNLGLVNGPTDGILIACAAILTNVFFPEFWSDPASKWLPAAVQNHLPQWFLDERMTIVIVAAGALTVLPTVAHNIYTVYKALATAKATPSHSESGPFVHDRLASLSYADPILRLVPFALLYTCAWLWAQPHAGNNVDGIMQSHPRLFVFAFGFLFCYLICKLMLAHLTAVDFCPFRWEVLPMTALITAQVFDRNGLVFPWSPLPALAPVWGWLCGVPLVGPTLGQLTGQEGVLLALLLFHFGLWLHFVVHVINEVTRALGICAFSIPFDKAKTA
jgi:ethanolaminephosphotransferase